MFERDKPASNIHELCHALEDDASPAHMYRGQVRFYETSVPSAFRPFVSHVEPSGWVKLKSTTELPIGGRKYEFEISDIKARLGRIYGRGVTNILAQQYGQSSDVFDMTSSIVVAAFFATRNWPTYQPYEPEGDELGVIYRMKCKSEPPDFETFHSTMEEVYLLAEDGSKKLFFDNVLQVLPEAGADSNSEGAAAAMLSQFPEGGTSVELFKQPFYCHPLIIYRAFTETMLRMGLDKDVGKGKAYGSLDELYANTRMAAQQGGSFSPPLRYSGMISKQVRAVDWNNDPDWFKAEPATAVHTGVNAVFNINDNPNFERFFFRHDPEMATQVDNLDNVWPGLDADFFFNLMMNVVSGCFEKHYGDPDFDPLNGILDRGYILDAEN